MNWIKGFALTTCLATPLSVILATSASAMAPVAPASAMSDVTLIQKTATSDAEKKAKATDCSKQADAKGLHGDARRKFRDTCKKS